MVHVDYGGVEFNVISEGAYLVGVGFAFLVACMGASVCKQAMILDLRDCDSWV